MSKTDIKRFFSLTKGILLPISFIRMYDMRRKTRTQTMQPVNEREANSFFPREFSSSCAGFRFRTFA